MLKISVIIPVFNAAKYLRKCMDSICNQTYKEIEIICINDGSGDDSLSILNEYASSNTNIIVINQPNQGVSTARNNGIERATGQYITFIDSDDFVEAEYVNKLVSSLREPDIDFVCSGAIVFSSEGDIKTEELNPSTLELTNSPDIIKFLQTPLNTSTWSKLYRSDLIKKNNLRFKPGLSLGEDSNFNYHYFAHCNKIVISDYVGYHYRIDVGSSLSHQNHTHVLLRIYDDINQKKTILHQKGVYDEDASKYIAELIIHLLFDELVRQSVLPKQERDLEDLKHIVSDLGESWEKIKEYKGYLQISGLYKWLFFNKKFEVLMTILGITNKRI